MLHRSIATGCAVLLLAAAGCKPASQQDVQELREQVAALGTKLDSIDQKLDGARAAARPMRPTEDFDKVYDIPVGSAPVLGRVEAPITLVEYSDFQCPFCARADPLIKEVQQKYAQQVRVVFKHFPLSFHEAARPMALASMAAQEQGKFWEFHNAVFANHDTLAADPSTILSYATQAGLDVERFKRDLETNRAQYEARVDADLQEGTNVDVRGTPTLYLNGKKLDPRQRSLEGMSATIDQLLSKQG